MTSTGRAIRASASDDALARIVRAETGQIVAVLARTFGSLDIAEEAVAAAVEEALREWRARGVPPRPGAWLTTAARHNALDAMRRDSRYREKLALISQDVTQDRSEPASGPDERLPLLFGCCHPALAAEAQLALTLRAVVGLTTSQIARATVEPVGTVAQRIVRAKRKISASGIPLRVPTGQERAQRLDLVLTVVSVMYDAAHLRADADASTDRDLAEDALWLATVVTDELPDEAEAHGLRSLLLFHRARDAARARDGELVPLPLQDRRLWDRGLITAAHASLERAAALRRPGRWQLQAAIAACHSDADDAAATDWRQVLALYDLLLRYDRSPVVRLNRAVAVAEVSGVDPALAELDALSARLGSHHLWHAVRGELLRRAGCAEEALAAHRRAIELTSNEAERRLLAARSRV